MCLIDDFILFIYPMKKKNPSMLPCSLTLKEKGLKSSAKWYEVNIVLSFLLSDKWKFTQHNI